MSETIKDGIDDVAGAGSADKTEGKIREVIGQGKSSLGDALDNNQLRADGAVEQVEGKAQQFGGVVQEKGQDVKEAVTGEHESLVDKFKDGIENIVENFKDGLHGTHNAEHPVD